METPEQKASEMLAAVLDAFAVAVCIVDAKRSVRMMNRAARALIEHRKGGLLVREQVLCGIEISVTARLADALHRVCSGHIEEDAFQILGGPTGARLQVHVSPLPDWPVETPSAHPPALVIFAQDTNDYYSVPALRTLFGLSNAEAGLLKELLNGRRLEECAEIRGTTVGTARTQLKAIFTKTGTSSQAQLVALAKMLPATVSVPQVGRVNGSTWHKDSPGKAAARARVLSPPPASEPLIVKPTPPEAGADPIRSASWIVVPLPPT